MKNISQLELNNAFILAKNNMNEQHCSRSYCGRVYLVFTEKFRTGGDFYKKLKNSCSFRILNLQGSSLKSLYIGYDNATGKELKLANALQSELTKIGLSCYVEAIAD